MSSATAARATTAPVAAAKGTYALYSAPRWQVGDVVSSEGTTKTTAHVTSLRKDGTTAPLADVEDTVTASWMEKCAGVDADGKRTRYLVYVSQWSRHAAAGAAADESIQGSYFAVSGSGPSRRFSIVEGTHEWTPEAGNWLTDHFGSRSVSDEQWLRMLLLEKGVAAGESWTPDPDLVASVLGESGLGVDASKVTARVTLKAVENNVAQCGFKMSLKTLSAPEGNAAWTKGGTMTLDGEMAVPLFTPLAALANFHCRASVEGEAADVGGGHRQYSLQVDERRATTPGGTFPQPATAPERGRLPDSK